MHQGHALVLLLLERGFQLDDLVPDLPEGVLAPEILFIARLESMLYLLLFLG